MPDIDSVMRGGGRMKDAGFAIEWGPGRHGPGDNAFNYFVGPFGEVIEYTASITFGFFTGVLMRQSVILARSPKVRSNKLVMMGTRLVQQKLGIAEGKRGIAPNRIPSLIWTAVSAGSAITSIVTGLRQFLS